MALLFQVVGRLSWNLIFGALAATGLMSPKTRQYSPTVAVAATVCVLVTTAPVVGRPMAAVVTVLPLRSAQVSGCACGASSSAPPHDAN